MGAGAQADSGTTLATDPAPQGGQGSALGTSTQANTEHNGHAIAQRTAPRGDELTADRRRRTVGNQ